jgi:type IV secretory pathway VirB2 component (pilin)
LLINRQDFQTGAVASAVSWLDGALLGSMATIIAIIAVASLGMLLMAGRVHSRRAMEVVLGCFIIFGASSIAAGLLSILNSSDREGGPQPSPPPASVSAPAVTQSPVTTAPYDPYAGAAVPPRR